MNEGVLILNDDFAMTQVDIINELHLHNIIRTCYTNQIPLLSNSIYIHDHTVVIHNLQMTYLYLVADSVASEKMIYARFTHFCQLRNKCNPKRKVSM